MKKFIAMLVFAVQCSAVTVYWRDDFESNAYNLDSTAINNWDVTPSVDVVGPGTWGISNCYNSSNTCVDLDGTGLPLGGTISRTFSVLRDGPHLLEWYSSGSQRNFPATQFSSMLVTITDGVNTRDSVVTLRWNHQWHARAMPFQVTNIGSVTVSFTGLDNYDVGLLLDNVQFIDPRNGIISTVIDTPEPAYYAVVGLVLIVLSLYKKKI